MIALAVILPLNGSNNIVGSLHLGCWRIWNAENLWGVIEKMARNGGGVGGGWGVLMGCGGRRGREDLESSSERSKSGDRAAGLFPDKLPKSTARMNHQRACKVEWLGLGLGGGGRNQGCTGGRDRNAREREPGQ
jgi:hypothetical protein